MRGLIRRGWLRIGPKNKASRGTCTRINICMYVYMYSMRIHTYMHTYIYIYVLYITVVQRVYVYHRFRQVNINTWPCIYTCMNIVCITRLAQLSRQFTWLCPRISISWARQRPQVERHLLVLQFTLYLVLHVSSWMEICEFHSPRTLQGCGRTLFRDPFAACMLPFESASLQRVPRRRTADNGSFKKVSMISRKLCNARPACCVQSWKLLPATHLQSVAFQDASALDSCLQDTASMRVDRTRYRVPGWCSTASSFSKSR